MTGVDTTLSLDTASARLAAVSDTPRLDAELLLAHALGTSRAAVLLARPMVPASFAALVERRLRHEPLAYITGSRGFWSIDLAVAPGVLIPRPDSETLLDAAVAHFRDTSPARILDLGTGSGALLLAALVQWPNATGVGIDASSEALAIAQRNADTLGLSARARLQLGDWMGTGEAFDLVLCNPPYVATTDVLPRDVVEWEPAAALFAGADGLDAYRLIARLLGAQIAGGGVACVEIGHTQREAATALFARQGLSVTCRRDLAGRDRCLVVKNRLADAKTTGKPGD